MAIYNLGSINIDNFYQVPHIPAPGETIAAGHMSVGLGGKGANMSVAAARGAARVVHIGAIGAEGAWTRDRLTEYGVDTRFIVDGTRTGHAIICVAEDGENAITLFTGANHEITSDLIGSSLSEAQTGDIFVTQNETNAQEQACEMAKRLGLRVAYAAAPFDAEAVQAVLPYIDMLIMNQIEADQLTNALGLRPDQLDVRDVIVPLVQMGAVGLIMKMIASMIIPRSRQMWLIQRALGTRLRVIFWRGWTAECRWNRRSALHRRPHPSWSRVRVQRMLFQT